jgi:serine/threonine protein kinase
MVLSVRGGYVRNDNNQLNCMPVFAPPMEFVDKVHDIFKSVFRNNLIAMAEYFNRAFQKKDKVKRKCFFGESRYLRRKLIDFGAFSNVYSAYDRLTGQIVAIKEGKIFEPFMMMQTIKLMQSEIERQEIASSVTSTILKVKDFYVKKEGGALCFVMEKLPSPNLYIKYIKPSKTRLQMPADRVIDIGYNVLRTIKKLEENKILHADIKPENLSDDNGLTVLDLGSAMSLEQNFNNYFRSFIQTRRYRSPEAMLRAPLTIQSDMWSLGCVLFGLYTQTNLFNVSGGDSLDTERSDLQLIIELLGEYPPQTMIDESLDGYYKNFLVRKNDGNDGEWQLMKIFPRLANTKSQSIESRMELTWNERLKQAQMSGKESCDDRCDVGRLIGLVKSFVAYDRPSIDDAIAMFD